MVEQRGVFVTKPSEVRARAEAERKGVRVTVARGLPSGVLRRGVARGGFVGRTTPSAVSEQLRQAELNRLSTEINREKLASIKEANRQLNKDLRGVKSRQERLNLQKRFNEQIGLALEISTAKRVEAGIITSGKSIVSKKVKTPSGGTKIVREKITKESAPKIIKELSKIQREVKVVKKVGITPFIKKEVKAPKRKFARILGPSLSEVTKEAFDILEKEGFTKERIAKIITGSPEKIDDFKFLKLEARESLKDLQSFSKGAIIGSLEGLEKEPVKIVAITAASFFGPGLIAKVGKAIPVASLLSKVPTPIRRKGAKAVSTFLGGLYLTSAGLEIAGEPTIEEKGKKTGNILTTEVAPFVIGTRGGVKSVLRNEIKKELNLEVKKLSPQKRAAFEDYMKQAELLGKFEPKTKNIKLDNIKSISDPKAQSEIRKWLKRNSGEVIVGGSTAQTGQLNVKRALGDMDLYLESRNPNQASRELANQLKKAGVQRVSSIRGQVTIGGKKSIEFHNVDRLLANIQQVTPFWQNPRRYIIRTPEGIRIQRVGLQARRKVVAAFADPKRLATGKYKKDLQDFKSIADKLFRKAELNARSSFFFREAKIKRIEKIFGKKISRKPIIPKIEKLKKVPKVKVKGVGIKKPPKIKISKKPIKFREPEIIRRSKIKTSQKPFSKIPSQLPIKLRVKRLFPPSQKKVLKEAPSQIPFTKIPKRLIPGKPIRKPEPPSQPPFFIPSRVFPPPTPFKKITRPPIEPPRKPMKPVKGLFERRRETKKLIERKPTKLPGYNIFIKRGSLKGLRVRRPTQEGRLRFLKANLRPLTRKNALSLGAFVTDRTISQTFKVKEIGRKAQEPLVKFPRNYFKDTSRKWRGKIVKGKEQPIKNLILERRKVAIDTLGEKRKLRASAEIARLQKSAKIKLKRQLKTRKLKVSKLIKIKK